MLIRVVFGRLWFSIDMLNGAGDRVLVLSGRLTSGAGGAEDEHVVVDGAAPFVDVALWGGDGGVAEGDCGGDAEGGSDGAGGADGDDVAGLAAEGAGATGVDDFEVDDGFEGDGGFGFVLTEDPVEGVGDGDGEAVGGALCIMELLASGIA